jgi:hypothetical protein
MPHIGILSAIALHPEIVREICADEAICLPAIELCMPEHFVFQMFKVTFGDKNISADQEPSVMYPAPRVHQVPRIWYNTDVKKIFFQHGSFLQRGNIIPVYAP